MQIFCEEKVLWPHILKNGGGVSFKKCEVHMKNILQWGKVDIFKAIEPFWTSEEFLPKNSVEGYKPSAGEKALRRSGGAGGSAPWKKQDAFLNIQKIFRS